VSKGADRVLIRAARKTGSARRLRVTCAARKLSRICVHADSLCVLRTYACGIVRQLGAISH